MNCNEFQKYGKERYHKMLAREFEEITENAQGRRETQERKE